MDAMGDDVLVSDGIIYSLTECSHVCVDCPFIGTLEEVIQNLFFVLNSDDSLSGTVCIGGVCERRGASAPFEHAHFSSNMYNRLHVALSAGADKRRPFVRRMCDIGNTSCFQFRYEDRLRTLVANCNVTDLKNPASGGIFLHLLFV
jgi:hypothetical protein